MGHSPPVSTVTIDHFLNFGLNPLILYTIRAPAQHNEKTVYETKVGGDKAEQEGEDEPLLSEICDLSHQGCQYNPFRLSIQPIFWCGIIKKHV